MSNPKGDLVNLSIRGKGVREKFLESIKDVPSAKGGGHKDAIGAQMNEDELDKFKENFEKAISVQNKKT